MNLDTQLAVRVCIYVLKKTEIVCIYTHLDSREVIRRLQADGWQEVAQKGSHKQFKHPTKPGRVTVPAPKKDIPAGTLRSIERQAGIRLR